MRIKPKKGTLINIGFIIIHKVTNNEAYSLFTRNFSESRVQIKNLINLSTATTTSATS